MDDINYMKGKILKWADWFDYLYLDNWRLNAGSYYSSGLNFESEYCQGTHLEKECSLLLPNLVHPGIRMAFSLRRVVGWLDWKK